MSRTSSISSRSRRARLVPFAAVAALALVAVGAAPASAGVIVVDQLGGPGSQFTQVQAAVNAAVDGDVVLVRQGQYNPVSIGNKSVVIQGEGVVSLIDPNFEGGGGLGVFGLAAGKRIVLRNLQVWGQMSFANGIPSTALGLSNCAGSVWIDSCTIKTQMVATNCANLVITNSSLRGGDCLAPPLAALPALILDATNAYVHGSTLVGGTGSGAETTGVPFPDPAAVGSPALRATGGTTLVASCELTGGAGGNGYDHPIAGCLTAGAGGPAFHLASGNPVVRYLDTQLALGAPGNTPAGCTPPASGPLTVVDTGTLELWPGAPVGFTAHSPVREQQSLRMLFSDIPGTSIFVLASASTGSVLLPGHLGAFHLGSPFWVVPAGAIPAGGTALVNLPIPELPAGLEGIVIFLQGASLPSMSPWTIGPPAAVVLLDASF
jgi:hypothetical protein